MHRMGHVSFTRSREATTCTPSSLARRGTSVSSATPSSPPSADSSSTPRTNSPGQRSATPPRIHIMCGTVGNIPGKELYVGSGSIAFQPMSPVQLKRCVRSALLFVGYTEAILCCVACHVEMWGKVASEGVGFQPHSPSLIG